MANIQKYAITDIGFGVHGMGIVGALLNVVLMRSNNGLFISTS